MSKKEKKEKKHKKERKKEKRKQSGGKAVDEGQNSKKRRLNHQEQQEVNATIASKEKYVVMKVPSPENVEPAKKKEKKNKKKGKDKSKKHKKRETDKEELPKNHPPIDEEAASSKYGDNNQHVMEERPIVESSALAETKEVSQSNKNSSNNVTLLLFYQYVEPPWSNDVYKDVLVHVDKLGQQANVTGRMRVAREGLNCTLTGSRTSILTFCRSLRRWKPQHFLGTEFKLTHDLPEAQRFGSLKLIPVQELVHYGLEGDKAPPLHRYHGTHLEPHDYHQALSQTGTVVIDVRNHYEANIGRFDPPQGSGAEYIDPQMRKSTEFPVWLDKDETKSKLKNKRVLMYCTGGIRCERASALLKYKMEHDPAVRDLNIQGVYQLQGGIDKYFKDFPDGGYWKGKNFTFDRRFAHAPPAHEDGGAEDQKPTEAAKGEPPASHHAPMGKCEGCGKAWDKYRGKRRCPTCGVPSLTCKDCFQADQNGTKKLDKKVRCDLCVEQGIFSKQDLRNLEQRELEAYEVKMAKLKLLHPEGADSTKAITNCTSEMKCEEVAVPNNNPDGVTRLFLKNMCRQNMTEQVLMDFLPGITHIVWRTDHRSGNFFGQAWVEFQNTEAAGNAMAKSGETILGRPLYMVYQPPNAKDSWPPPNSAVV